VLSRLSSRPAAWALLLGLIAVTSSVAACAWKPNISSEGLTMRVEVPRGGGWHEVARTPATLPLQRDLRALRASLAADDFRATWTGTFLAARSGLHEFNVASDDGSRVWIDDTLVVDNSGRHARQWRSGIVTLAAGPHIVRIEYEQWGGDAHLETWLRQPGGLSQRLDAVRRQFAPGPVTRVERAARTLRGWLPWVAVSAGCAAYGALLLAAGLALFRRIERRAGVPPATWRLALALAFAVMPIATGLLWGLPADADGWAPDELTPARLVEAGEQRFVAPWTSIYPPLQFFVLSPLTLAVNWLAIADGWSAATYPGSYVLHAAMRVCSVLMAVGVLGWLYLLVRLHGTAAQGIAAVVAGASCSTLLYYGKTANVDVPYLYWVLCACVCVAAVARRWSAPLVVTGAVAGACAIGTKDQAAGFLLLMPIWLVVIRWRDLARHGHARPWLRTLRDPVWWQATAAAAVTLAVIYLVPLDWTSVPRHLESARRATYAPMVPGTPLGQVRLLLIELELLTFMLGIPLAGATVGGLVWMRTHLPGLAAAIGVPILSYVVLFLPVIRYTYDRFLLGVALLLACAAGPFCLWVWHQRRWRPVVLTLGTLGALYTAGHALSVNALMARDSRYAVEVTLAERAAQRRELVGLISPRTYLPRVDLVPVVDLEATVADVEEWSPDVLVFNRAWLNRFQPADAEGHALRQAVEDGSLGFRRLATWQSSLPWWAFQARPGHLGRYSRLGLTNLDKANPQLELWVR